MNFFVKARQWCGQRTAHQPVLPDSLSPEEAQALKKRLARLWAGRDLPCLAEARFLVLDTETTGFHPFAGDELISVGAVLVEEGHVVEEKSLHRLINPGRCIPPEVQRLTGISEEAVSGAPDFWQVLGELLPLLEDSVLVGHVISFDLAFINLKLKHCCGVKLPNPTVDTRLLSQTLHPHRATHSLDALIDLYGIKPRGRHTALGDALMTAEVFQIFLKSLRAQGVTTLRELYQYTRYSLRSNRLATMTNC